MFINRRSFVHAACTAAVVTLTAHPLDVAKALIRGGGKAIDTSGFNGGRSQVNFNFLQGGGEYPFLNFLKISQPWQWNDNSSADAITPDLLDSNGYPLSSALFTTHGGLKLTGITFPSSTARPGNYVSYWTGNGTTTLISGTACTYSVTTASKAAQCVVTLASKTSGGFDAPLAVGQQISISGATGTGWSILNATQTIVAIDATGLLITINLDTSAVSGTLGGTITASNILTSTNGAGRCVYTPSNYSNQGIGITAIGSPRITDVALCHVDDEASLRAGGIFGVKFLSRLREAKFSVLRFMNWQQNATQNNVATWATANRPTTYAFYQGGWISSDLLCNLAGSGVTTNSGADYTVSAPTTWSTSGGLPVDKSTVHLVYNATSPTTATVTFTPANPNITWTSHGLAADNLVYLTNSGGALPPEFTATGFTGTTGTFYFVVVVDANTIKLSTTAGGGSIVTPSTAGTGTHTARTYPRVNVGGTALIPILDGSANKPTVSGNGYMTGGSKNSFDTLVYDALLNCWMRSGLTSSQGQIANGCPYSIMIALCRQVGAHPWFVSPVFSGGSTYHTQLATLCRDTGPSWFVPRFEGPNECWGGQGTTGYASAISAQTPGWGGSADINNWYGRFVSIMGQDVNAVYGGAVDGTKYRTICGLQLGSLNNPASNDNRLKAAKYVADGGTPAHQWVTSIAPANYTSPWVTGYHYEAPLAYANWTGDASAKDTYVGYMSGIGGSPTFVTTTLTLANHGFTADKPVAVFPAFGSTMPTGLSTGTTYWVLSSGLTANTFQLSASEGGAAISLSGGSGTFYVFPGSQNSPCSPMLEALARNAAAWANSMPATNKVIECDFYEGGYSPDYGLSQPTVTSPITGVTALNPLTMTLATASVTGGRPGTFSTANSPAAVVGMSARITGIVGTLSAINNTILAITGVSGTSVTFNFDATGLAYTSGGSAEYYADATTPMSAAMVTLRYQGKNSTALQTVMANNYANLVAISQGQVNGYGPSCFQMGGNTTPYSGTTIPSSNVWQVLEDIFQTPDPPQWLAIKAFNA